MGVCDKCNGTGTVEQDYTHQVYCDCEAGQRDMKTAAAIDKALERVCDEVVRAMQLHPPYRSGHEGYAIIAEELDELWDEVKRDDVARAIEEAVQVACTAVRFVVDLELQT